MIHTSRFGNRNSKIFQTRRAFLRRICDIPICRSRLNLPPARTTGVHYTGAHTAYLVSNTGPVQLGLLIICIVLHTSHLQECGTQKPSGHGWLLFHGRADHSRVLFPEVRRKFARMSTTIVKWAPRLHLLACAITTLIPSGVLLDSGHVVSVAGV